MLFPVWCGGTWLACLKPWPQTHPTHLGWTGTSTASQALSAAQHQQWPSLMPLCLNGSKSLHPASSDPVGNLPRAPKSVAVPNDFGIGRCHCNGEMPTLLLVMPGDLPCVPPHCCVGSLQSEHLGDSLWRLQTPLRPGLQTQRPHCSRPTSSLPPEAPCGASRSHTWWTCPRHRNASLRMPHLPKQWHGRTPTPGWLREEDGKRARERETHVKRWCSDIYSCHH